MVALAGADLELREGEFLTLLGPSGSGKTTLLMMVAGLIQPDSGEVWIDGQLATYAPPFKRDVGMVFQNYALFPHLTVGENIAFPLRMRGVAEATIQREVQRVLEVVRLPDVGSRLPRALSGGQQQRVALARCMVYKPSIILMDEPLGALDKKLRDQMQLEIKQLHAELRITVLYVTHDQEEAMIMSDRICLMRDGHIEQIGTPDELYFQPRTRFAAEFLGESNVLACEVVGVEASHVVVTVSGVRLLAPQDERLRDARRVALMVRPERLAILDAQAARPRVQSENRLEGCLRQVIRVSGLTRYYVGLDSGQTIVASTLTGDAKTVATSGSRVALTWPPDAGILLPTGATTS